MQNKDEMIPFVYFAYSNGVTLPKEAFIRDKLSQFGTIVSVLMRPAYNSNLKSYFLVEYNTVEEAISCRFDYNFNDSDKSKKVKLGDRDLEINILIGSKVMRPFEANILSSVAGMHGNSLSRFESSCQTIRCEELDLRTSHMATILITSTRSIKPSKRIPSKISE